MESDNDADAFDPLAAVSEARSAAADRLITPWWYHPALGLLLAAYGVVVSFGNTLIRGLAVVALLGAVALLAQAYRRLTGVWVWGYSAGRATRWAYALAGVAVAAIIASVIITNTTSLIWPTWALAAVVGVAVVVLGRRFDDTLRRELRGQLQSSEPDDA